MLQAVSSPPSPTSTHHAAHQVHQTATSLTTLTSSLSDGKTHLLLASSGSVATIKLPQILSSLSKSYPPSQLSVRVLLTPSATNFLSGQSPEQPHYLSLYGSYPILDAIYTDPDEWRSPGWTRGDGVLHIELRRWADLMVIAPLSANTLAKVANGMADGLLTSVVRAWDAWGDLDGAGGGQQTREKKLKRILVAPAMNTAMWRHPVTGKQLRVLEEEWGVSSGGQENGDGSSARGGWFEVLRPIQKTLACGDVGDGAMVEYGQIVRAIEERLGLTTANGGAE